MILSATATAAWTGRMKNVTDASFESAKSAVTIAIGLIGAMALWLGIMKVAEKAGIMKIIAKKISPIMKWLFPDVPEDHPAMRAMIMNIAANILGLGNAATPMGIKAMQELDTLNTKKETATDAMCLFLAINTSSVTLLPLGVITVRAAAGATNPAGIVIPSILATICSTTAAIFFSKLFSKYSKNPAMTDTPYKKAEEIKDHNEKEGISVIGKAIVSLFILIFIAGMTYSIIQTYTKGNITSFKDIFSASSSWLIPILISIFLIFGYFKGVKLYETVTEGAKEGFTTAVKIIPFMVAIFVAVGMFRASGALNILTALLEPVTSLIGMPSEALPMALIRPLSGSGAFGIMSETVSREPNSFLSFLMSTMQGSTETTFYVLAVYFGAVGVKITRHALPAALLADVTGIITSLLFCKIFF